MRHPVISPEQEEKMKTLYETGITVPSICTRFGVGKQKVYSVLRSTGANVRKAGANDLRFIRGGN